MNDGGKVAVFLGMKEECWVNTPACLYMLNMTGSPEFLLYNITAMWR